MKRCLLLFLIIMLLPVSIWAAENLEAGVKELSVELSSRLEGKAKIAVVPFSNLDGDVTSLGKFIAEELITALLISEQQNYEIIERRQLNRVLEEQDLSIGDILEPEAIQKIGKILGVDAIVTGSTADLGNRVRLNCRVISASTAKVYAACQTTIPKVGIVEELLSKVGGARIESFDPDKTSGSELENSTIYPIEEELGDVRVNVESVKYNANKITVEFKVYNNAQTPMIIGLYGGKNGTSRQTKINNEGDIYFSTSIRIVENSCINACYVQEMVSGKSWVKGKVEFENVPSLDFLEILQIHFFYKKGGWKYRDLILRNISIQG